MPEFSYQTRLICTPFVITPESAGPRAKRATRRVRRSVQPPETGRHNNRFRVHGTPIHHEREVRLLLALPIERSFRDLHCCGAQPH